MSTPSLHVLDPVVRDYAWGSRVALAELRGLPGPTPTPEAELWFGAHPSAPSRLSGGGTLLDLIDADPDRTLGADVARRFDGRLPYLVKLLAADQPLSLQAHPSAAQARAGFDREERDGPAIDAPDRCYRDPWPKPELLHALTPFAALCGFRDVATTIDLLAALDVAAVAAVRRALVDEGESALPRMLREQLRAGAWSSDERSELAQALQRLARSDGPYAEDAARTADLLERYPDDPGVRIALLMRGVTLTPGEALALPAGNLHAYLGGVGVEVMATSDNVVRGGLTVKHVDVDELLRVVDARVLPPPLVPPTSADGTVTFAGPTEHFVLHRIDLGRGRRVRLDRVRGGPEVVIAVGGGADLAAGGEVVAVPSGGGAFVAADATTLEVSGSGQVFRTTVGAEDEGDEDRMAASDRTSPGKVRGSQPVSPAQRSSR